MKVVCIRDDWKLDDIQKTWNVTLPVKGTVYTIRQSLQSVRFGVPFYLLEEIINPVVTVPDGTLQEPNFDSRLFRRLTDISSLQALTVVKTKTKTLEDA